MSASAVVAVVVCAAILYLGGVVFVSVVLHADMLRNDAPAYWRDSFAWRMPYSHDWIRIQDDLQHLRAYAVMLAAARAATLGLLSPIVVMWMTAGVFYVAGAGAIHAVLEDIGVSHPFGWTLVYLLFPFVGLAEAVYPIADSMAWAAFLFVVLTYVRQAWPAFTILAIIAVLVHKALWFFIPPLVVLACVKYRDARRLVWWGGAPFFALYSFGVIYHGDPLWVLGPGARRVIVPRGSAMIVEGLVAPFLAGNVFKIVKGSVILAVVVLAVTTFFVSLHKRFVLGAVIALPTVMMALVLNEHEIWAVVRYAKGLVIPLAVLLTGATRINVHVFVAGAVGGLLSNALFLFYMTRFFGAKL